MRRIALLVCVVAVAFWVGCGKKYSSSTPTTPASKIAKRAFVSNQTGGVVHIVDAAKDALSASSINGGSAPTQMVESQDKKQTVVYSSGSNSLVVIDNTAETAKSSLALRSATESFAISSDDRFVFVAERNTIASGATLAGAVEIFDTNNLAAGATVVSVPGARGLVLSHNGSTLLVFADDSDKVSIINTGNTAAGPSPVPGFDRPVFAVFTSDDSTAYVLNCGPECGGTAASVSSLSVGTQTIMGTSMPITAARIALLNGTTLYVAGTRPTGLGTLPSGGWLNVINASGLTITNPSGAPNGVPISDGIHDRIALGSNGKLFIGARACSNVSQGCLSIYDTVSNPATAVIHATYLGPSGAPLPGDITGIEPIPSRNVVYVCEGGELRIYDTTTNGLQQTQIDIVGKAVDVKEVF